MSSYPVEVFDIVRSSWRNLSGSKWSFVKLLILFLAVYLLAASCVVWAIEYWGEHLGDAVVSMESILSVLGILIIGFYFTSVVCGMIVQNALRVAHGQSVGERDGVLKYGHKVMLIITLPTFVSTVLIKLISFVPLDSLVLGYLGYAVSLLINVFLFLAIYIYFERGDNCALGAIKASICLACCNFFAFIRFLVVAAIIFCLPLLFWYVAARSGIVILNPATLLKGLLDASVNLQAVASDAVIAQTWGLLALCFILYVWWLIPLSYLMVANFSMVVSPDSGSAHVAVSDSSVAHDSSMRDNI